MTELLVLWIGSSIVSLCLKLKNGFRIFKDIADAGYKINLSRASEVIEQFNPDTLLMNRISVLIPIYNILHAFKQISEYDNIRGRAVEQLSVMGLIEEMTEEEKIEYQKKPTGLNAAFLPLKLELNQMTQEYKEDIRLSNATKLNITDENGSSDIYFETGKSHDDITILKVTGPAAELTVEEQKELIIDELKLVVNMGVNKYGDDDKFLNVASETRNLDLIYEKAEEKQNDEKYEEELLEYEEKQLLEKPEEKFEDIKNTRKISFTKNKK